VPAHIDLPELRAALLDRLEPLAENLLGQHNRARSRRTQWRWGNQGSFSLEIAGRKRGAWYDHEAAQGGGPIELIQHVLRRSRDESITWGADFTGLSRVDRPEHHAEAEQRRQERERKRSEREAEAAADEQRRIGDAQHVWSRVVTPAYTIADRYLVETRGIPRPADGWPEAVQFLPDRTVTRREEAPDGKELRRTVATAGALVLSATLPDGTVRGLQRIYLTADADNLRRSDGGKVKLTLGVLEDAVARLPGPPDGPLLVAEGPETGLSVWAASGYETHVALGSLGNLRPQLGRSIVLCRDDDPQHSPADKALMRTLTAWREAGVDLVVAQPWPDRRGDKSDFNDVLRASGVDAVRDRIMVALDPGPQAPRRLPVEAGRRVVAEAVAAFFEAAEAWGKHQDAAALPDEKDDIRFSEIPSAEEDGYEVDPDDAPSPDDPPPIHLVQIDTGGGKSDAARIAAARFLTGLRQRGDKRTVAMAVPTHTLGAEQAQRFEQLSEVRAAGLRCRIWRGRRADNPDAPGETMCRNLDLVREVQALKLDVRKRACAICPHREDCAYLGQRKQRADLWLVAHQIVFEAKPRALGDIAAVIIDENPLTAALEGIDRAITLPLGPFIRIDDAGSPLATDQLLFLRRLALDVLTGLPDGPLPRDAFRDAGFLPTSAQEARALEWQTRIDVELSPNMTPAARREALGAAARNADLGRRVMFWTALHTLLQPGAPAQSGWGSLSTEDDKDGHPVRLLTLKGRREVGKRWRVPTLHLDATARPELLRHVWPDMRQTADVRLLAPHQRIFQTGDCAFALSRLDVEAARSDDERLHRQRNLRDLHAIICRTARHYRGRVLVVAQARIEEALQAAGNLPGNIEWGHHNGVRGRDVWGPNGKDGGVSLLIVVGRTMPPSTTIARMGEALTGQAMPAQQYERGTAWRELADSTTQRCEAMRYPDPVGEALRWQACEAEVMQIIGRARGVNRGLDNPVDVLVLTDTPLPFPVTLIPAATLDPSPDDLMLAAGGVVLTNCTDAATAYPGLWRTREAAKKALQRSPDKSATCRVRLGTIPYEDISLIRECPQPLRAVEYQRAGAGRSVARAFYDPALVTDPVAWLFEKLGELADWDTDAALPEAGGPEEPERTPPEAGLTKPEEVAAVAIMPAAADGVAKEVADGYGDLLTSRELFRGAAAPSQIRPMGLRIGRVSLSTVGDPDRLPKASATLFSSYQSALFLALMM
jgi:putative DNA primase/helicase